MKSVRKTALLAHQLQYFSNPCANKAFLRTDYFCLELEKLKAEQLCSAKSLIPRLEVIALVWLSQCKTNKYFSNYRSLSENYFPRRLTSTFLLPDFDSLKRSTLQFVNNQGLEKIARDDEDVHLHLHNIYRYMDKLYNTQQEKVQQISVAHTMEVLGGSIGIAFFFPRIFST